MPYEIGMAKRARKDFSSLMPKIQQQLVDKIDRLTEPYQAPNVKAMRGEWASYFRMRSGDYRIVFTVDDDSKRVEITHIFNRQDSQYPGD